MFSSRVQVFAVLSLMVASCFSCGKTPHEEMKARPKIRFSVAPFQDTLLPIIGDRKGWYKDAGLDVEITLLPWYNGQEALVAGTIDVGMGNIASVIGAHHNAPNNVYFYGFNVFDNGFAIMVRPGSGIKTYEQLKQQLGSPEAATKAAISQLKGKTVITTSRTDMEQVVSYAVRGSGMKMYKDVKIIDLEPDEGLAAFIGGKGDAYVGGIPQRTKALKEGDVELISGPALGPPEINGFVTTRKFATEHSDELLALLRVMFKIIDYTNHNIDDSANIIVAELHKNGATSFTVDDFKKYWNNYEHYTANSSEAQRRILDPSSPTYWKLRWDDTNFYFVHVANSIPNPVNPSDAFLMNTVQEQYIKKFGSQ